MPTEKRKQRAYKATDNDYKRAMKRAKKDKLPLATLIETIISQYGSGSYIFYFGANTNKQ